MYAPLVPVLISTQKGDMVHIRRSIAMTHENEWAIGDNKIGRICMRIYIDDTRKVNIIIKYTSYREIK
jgi:hypothetical protein